MLFLRLVLGRAVGVNGSTATCTSLVCTDSSERSTIELHWDATMATFHKAVRYIQLYVVLLYSLQLYIERASHMHRATMLVFVCVVNTMCSAWLGAKSSCGVWRDICRGS